MGVIGIRETKGALVIEICPSDDCVCLSCGTFRICTMVWLYEIQKKNFESAIKSCEWIRTIAHRSGKKTESSDAKHWMIHHAHVKPSLPSIEIQKNNKYFLLISKVWCEFRFLFGNKVQFYDPDRAQA